MIDNSLDRRTRAVAVVLAAWATTAGCASEEAPRLTAPVVVDASGMQPAATMLGYTVTVTVARAALRDLELTVGGDRHAARNSAGGWLIRRAWAHPGHQGGGEVTGELRGSLIVDWMKDGASLGVATLIQGRYRGANFTFRRATAAELPAGDKLVGHTFVLEGTANKAGRIVPFAAVLDMDQDTHLVGAPFDRQVMAADPPVLGLRLLPVDPSAPTETVFDQLDFFALADAAGSGRVDIVPGQPAHNLLFKALQIHDHYDVRTLPKEER